MWQHILSSIYREIVATFVHLNDEKGALDVISSGSRLFGPIPLFSKEESELYVAMALAFAERRRYDKAKKYLKRVWPPTTDTDSQVEMVKIMAESGDIEQAMNFTETIWPIGRRVMATLMIVRILFKFGKQEDAHKLLKDAAKIADHPWTLLQVAKLMVRVKMPSQAKSIVVKLRRVFEKEKKHPVDLAEISEIFSRLGMLAEARDCLLMAQSHLGNQWKEDWSANFGGQLTRARVLSAIAVASFRLGEIDEAKQLFNEAIRSAEGVVVSFDGNRPLTWQYIATCLAEVGDFERAFSVATTGMLLGDRARAYEEIRMVLEYSWDLGDISEEIVLKALESGLRHARRDGRVTFWVYLHYTLPFIAKLGGNVSELWRKLQVVEKVWEHINLSP